MNKGWKNGKNKGMEGWMNKWMIDRGTDCIHLWTNDRQATLKQNLCHRRLSVETS